MLLWHIQSDLVHRVLIIVVQPLRTFGESAWRLRGHDDLCQPGAKLSPAASFLDSGSPANHLPGFITCPGTDFT